MRTCPKNLSKRAAKSAQKRIQKAGPLPYLKAFLSLFLVLGLTGFFTKNIVYAAVYYSSGEAESSNLLDGHSAIEILKFGYNASSIPADTTLEIQFSQDGSTWYSSAGVLNGWDTLSQGDFTAYGDAIDLSSLGWSGEYFYYAAELTTTDTSATPVLDEIVLYYNPGPSVETYATLEVTPFSGTAYAEITALESGNATERGFEYGLTETATWSISESGSFEAETFDLELTGLSPGTTYYIRAYATNPAGTGYGEWRSFTTSVYAEDGSFTSANLLEGYTAVSIGRFEYTLSSLPSGATATIQFSQDSTNWYSAAGVLDATSALAKGNFAFNLCPLMWDGSEFYYKVALERGSDGDTPVLDEIRLSADDSEYTCGPAGHWKFEEGFGSVTGNSGWAGAGGAADGTIVGATWVNEGRFGKALSFDADSSVSATLPSIGYENSVALWVRPTSEAGATSKILVTDGKLTTNSSGAPVYGDCVGSALVAGEWSHVVAVSTSESGAGACAIYQDGVLTSGSGGGGGGETGVSFGTSVVIGGSGVDGFLGDMDEVQVYSYGLTADEVKVVYNRNAGMRVGTDGWNSADADLYGNPPVAHWKLDEGSGTTTGDSSGNGNEGALGGGTADYRPSWTGLGKFGNALSFDGTNDYISAGTGPSQVNTVSFWAKPKATTGYIADLNGTSYIWANSGTLTATGFTDPTIYINGIPSTTVTADTWQHITVTTETAVNASALDVGRVDGSGYFGGILDDLQFYDYARSQRQILQDMFGDSTGPHPIAKWGFDEGAGQTVDSSHAKKLKITNAAVGGTLGGSVGTTDNDPTWVTEAANCVQGGCLEFASIGAEYVNVGDTGLDVNSVCFWVNPATTSEPVLSLSAESYLEVVSGVATATGFTDATVYVDGVAGVEGGSTSGGGGAVEAGEWAHVCVVSGAEGSGVTADAVRFGVANEAFLDGKLDVVEMFNFRLTSGEVRSLYNLGSVSFR